MKRVAPDLRPIREKTLNELEGVAPGERPRDESAERALHELRRTPIGALSPAELRRAIRWRHGLPYLVPLAVERLEADPLLEATFARGDLLTVVLETEPHWGGRAALRDLRPRVRAVVEQALERLAAVRPVDWAEEIPDPDEPSEADRERLEPLLRDALGTLA